MGRLRSFFSGKSDKQSKTGIDINEIASKGEKRSNDSHENAKVKKFFVKFSGVIKALVDNREEITAPDYDFNDIFAASETDSYVKMALSKYKSLVYKAGYQLKGENDDAIAYIKKRFKIFGVTCNKPMDILFQEVGDDLVTYSNAFLIKARDEDGIYPGLQASNIFGNAPVSGYFRLDPRRVFIKTNKHGAVEYYIYKADRGKEQHIKPCDMVHLYIDRAPDKKYGTPRIVAALEDVKLLRRIEGNVMALIYRFSMPIYHWSIGLEKEGMGATDREIDELTDKVASMDIDGCIITNERTKVNAIGADKIALDASGYLSYFEKRVFSALGVSESQMGRGGSKQDADSMESQIHDSIKHFQRTISIFIENYILLELLLEGGFDPVSNENDYVYYEFNEISLDTKIKLENHEMAKFQGNLITFDEVRHAIGKKSNDVNPDNLYTNMITTKAAVDQIKAKVKGEIDVAKANNKLSGNDNDNTTQQTTTTSTIKGNGTQKSSKNASNGTIKSINTPTNQHGTSSVKIKESAGQATGLTEKISSKRTYIHKKYKNIFEIYQNTRDSAVINKSELEFILSVSFNEIYSMINSILQENFNKGASRCTKTDSNFVSVQYINDHQFANVSDYAKSSLFNIKEDIIKSISENEINDISELTQIFDKYEYRLDCLLSYYPSKATWCGYTYCAKMNGMDKLYVDFNSEDDAANHNDTIDLDNYALDDLPAFHPFCGCSLSLERKVDN